MIHADKYRYLLLQACDVIIDTAFRFSFPVHACGYTSKVMGGQKIAGYSLLYVSKKVSLSKTSHIVHEHSGVGIKISIDQLSVIQPFLHIIWFSRHHFFICLRVLKCEPLPV